MRTGALLDLMELALRTLEDLGLALPAKMIKLKAVFPAIILKLIPVKRKRILMFVQQG